MRARSSPGVAGARPLPPAADRASRDPLRDVQVPDDGGERRRAQGIARPTSNILPAPDFKIIDDPRITRARVDSRRRRVSTSCRRSSTSCGARCRSSGRGRPRLPANTCRLWHAERLEVTPESRPAAGPGAGTSPRSTKGLCLDVEYIQQMSPLLDLKIMLWTVGSGCEAIRRVKRGDPDELNHRDNCP